MMSAYITLLAAILCTVVTNGMDKTEMKIYRYRLMKYQIKILWFE